MSLFQTKYRSHGCGEINEALFHCEVLLSGWVDSLRDLGGVVFIDLRDRTGIVQVVFREEHHPELLKIASHLRLETVIQVKGIVELRPPDTINIQVPTGRFEVIAHHLEILNTTEPLPFTIENNTHAGETVRLKYRYLDLRRPIMQQNLELRAKVLLAARNYLHEQGFLEIETPILTRSTPEGARDFLVPSRMHQGNFYALPQSPQLFKQLLMVAGFDRYFQIARCFRDEDLRADRQPEFTQIDIEMSFVDREDILELTEGLLTAMFAAGGIQLPIPFPRMTFHEAMEKYGSDRPDTRYNYTMIRLDSVFMSSKFKILADAAQHDGDVVLGLRVPEGSTWARNRLDQLTEFARNLGAPGLFWFKISEDGSVQSPITKYLQAEELRALKVQAGLSPGDLLLAMSGPFESTCTYMGAIRREVARFTGQIPESNVWRPLWVIDFPLLEWNEEDHRWVARHHPFTSPFPEFFEQTNPEPDKILARSYDIVLNGVEIGGGSIRNHRLDWQKQVFHWLQIPPHEYEEKFHFLLEALNYGAPPHGGIALGVDRIIMMMAGMDSIRDVIAFPKTASGQCLMTGSPAPVTEKQLKELHLVVKP